MGRRDRSPTRASDRKRDRERDRDRDHHRDRDVDRRRSKRHRTESDRRGNRRHRERSRDRSRDRGDRRGRDANRNRRAGHVDAAGGRSKRGDTAKSLPPLANDCFCYICGKNHWTVGCPRLAARPADYPWMSRTKGCWRCGQKGHPASQCTVRKYRCAQCGDIHDTKDCAYDHIPEEWHEFFDPLTKHVFYARSDDASEVQWLPPSHELDVVMWHCKACQHLNPSKYNECLVCHSARPVSLTGADAEGNDGADAAMSSSSSSDDDDEEDDDDDDDSHTRSSSLSSRA